MRASGWSPRGPVDDPGKRRRAPARNRSAMPLAARLASAAIRAPASSWLTPMGASGENPEQCRPGRPRSSSLLCLPAFGLPEASGSDPVETALETEPGQVRMIGRPRAGGLSQEPALARSDRSIVDAGPAAAHQPVLGKRPHLVAVCAIPVAGIVVPLVPEADGDAVLPESPQRSLMSRSSHSLAHLRSRKAKMAARTRKNAVRLRHRHGSSLGVSADGPVARAQPRAVTRKSVPACRPSGSMLCGRPGRTSHWTGIAAPCNVATAA